jgi:putative zinc finger/helix-turn-helix YgiT family protein
MNADTTAGKILVFGLRSSDPVLPSAPCPECGGAAVKAEVRTEPFEWGMGSDRVELRATYSVHICRSCNIEFTGQEAEQAMHEAVCRHLRVLSPREIVGIRQSLKMTQAEISEITGIGVASLRRWEAGLLIQNRANDNLLRLLREPSVIEALKRWARKEAESRPHIADTTADVSSYVSETAPARKIQTVASR